MASHPPGDDPDLVLARSIAAVALPTALPVRAPWILGKAEAHLRRCHEEEPRSLVEIAGLGGGGERLAVDVLLHEGGWLDRFLAERGPLLPPDEALLARGWSAIPRTVFSISEIAPDGEAVLHDLRTGAHVAVAACGQRVGDLVCGRAVPDSEALIDRLLLDLAIALPGYSVVDDERRPAFPVGTTTVG